MDSERRQTDNTSGDRNGGWNLKQYVVIALVVFITFCCCILFFFMIYRYNGFADFWKKLTTILQPIIMGLVLAYLLNPCLLYTSCFTIWKTRNLARISGDWRIIFSAITAIRSTGPWKTWCLSSAWTHSFRQGMICGMRCV